SQVPQKFPSAMHYVHTLVKLVINEGLVHMPKPKDPIEEEVKSKSIISEKIVSYESLLQALKNELKKEDKYLNMCAVTYAIIRTRTLVEENEILQAQKNETLVCVE
ncbi:hypothetical protein KI387_021233, partial [Taxus chinensis]